MSCELDVPGVICPERYGPYTTCYNRYNRWGQKGIWKAIFDKFAQKSKDSLHMIDSTIVRAHRAAGGAKGGNWPKVLAAHAAVARRNSMPWSTGRPLAFALTGGEVHDARLYRSF